MEEQLYSVKAQTDRVVITILTIFICHMTSKYPIKELPVCLTIDDQEKHLMGLDRGRGFTLHPILPLMILTDCFSNGNTNI